MTSTIQNPTWETEHHSLCNPGWKLRLKFLNFPVDANRDSWINHARTCPQCKAYFARLDAAAQNAVHPEMEPTE